MVLSPFYILYIAIVATSLLENVQRCSIVTISLYCRPTIYLPSGWPFILVCFALRFIEGIGCALYYTTAYTLATEIFPDTVGFVIVSLLLCHCDNIYYYSSIVFQLSDINCLLCSSVIIAQLQVQQYYTYIIQHYYNILAIHILYNIVKFVYNVIFIPRD